MRLFLKLKAMGDDQHTLLAGRYHLQLEVGHGGMGRVWRAHDEVLDRDVAVKEVLPPRGLYGSEDVRRQRALREAQTAARVSHRGVVVVHDVISDAGRIWIIMELIPGPSLDQVIAEDGPLPVRKVASIGRQVLDALQTTHTAGILHRDVKPSNVLLAIDRVVLTDFGIATIQGDTGITPTGVIVGTPTYIAPERLRNEKATPASDLWSLGATLYVAVEGRPPFDDGDWESQRWAMLSTDPRPSPRAGPLAPLLDGLLRRNPSERITADKAMQMLIRAETPSLTSAPSPTVSATLPSSPHSTPRRSPPSSRQARGLGIATLIGAFLAVTAVFGDNLLKSKDAQPSSSDKGSSVSIPSGFHLHKDPSGFSIAIPDGWKKVPYRNGIEWRAPEQNRFLVIDNRGLQQERWRRGPGAFANWQWLEHQSVEVEEKFPGYHLIRLVETTYRGTQAADWEFTWSSSKYGVLHVLDRAYLPDDKHAYAIYFSAPDPSWTENTRYRLTFLNTFHPAR